MDEYISFFHLFKRISMNIENVLIIGSWPAGHTAAIYAWRALLDPLMYEWFLANGVAAWGQLTTTTDVENFPWFPEWILWPDLMERMREQSINSWCRIETATISKVDLSSRPFKAWTDWVDQPIYAKTIIIATWAVAKRLHLPGEESYRQRGVSACAVCDGALPMFRNQHLVVIGWGDAAVEEANYLTKYASKVTMLIRRDELRASKVMQERAFGNEKIEIMWNTEATEIVWDENGMTWLKIINNKTNETADLAAGGLFYAIGHTPAVEFLEGQLELDDANYIKTMWHMSTATSVEWVFAAGDVQDKKYRQAITSAGTWCMAALEAEHFLTAHAGE